MVYGDYNPAYLDGLRNHMKNTHTHILHSQLRATEGNLMLHPSPSDDFLFEKSQSSDTSTTYQKTRHHVLFSLIFFAGFLFEETKS